MRLTHIDLQVSDVDAAREFLETFFALPGYPPDFHVGFILDRMSGVRELYDRLKAAGVAMKLTLGYKGPTWCLHA